MAATTSQGTGPGSASNIKPLVFNGSVKTVNLESNAVTAAKLDNNALSKAPVVLNTATQTLDSSYAGIPLVFTRTAGVVVTLPAATGTGDVYKFFVNTTVTSNSYKVQVANATDVICGLAFGDDGDGEPANAWPSGASSDTITMDGSTQGGLKGDSIEIIDVATGLFSCKVFITQSGTEATPFSAAVS
jgi:hypothetical protein